MRFKIVSFDSNKPLESNSFPGMETVLEKIDSLNGNLDQIESYLRSFGFPIAKPLIRNLVRKGTLKDVLKVYLNPPLRVARGMVANTLDVIHSTTLPIEKLLADHPKLLETCRILVREMRERKEDTAFNLFRPNEIGLSPGIEQGRIVSDIEDRRGSREQIIHVAQLAGNHRSVTVVLPLVNGQTTLKLKGAGLSKLLATFGFNRLLFQSNTSFAEKNGLVKPFHVNDYQKGEEASKESLIESMQLNSWTSLVKKRNSFVGGFLLPQAEQETLRSYAMQSLMMMIDQGKGSTASLPLRLDMVNTVVVRRGAVEIRLAAEEYFTSSELLTKGELYTLASEAYVKANADEKKLLEDYVETLRTSGSSSEIAFNAGKIIKKYVTPVVLTKRARAGLRISHAWDAIFEPKHQRIRKVKHFPRIPTTKADIDQVLAYIYHYYGEEFKLPDDLPDDHPFIKMKQAVYESSEPYSLELNRHIRKIYEYLKKVSELNHEAAERTYKRFIRSFYREIGVMHGAGGHFGGDKVRLQLDPGCATSADNDSVVAAVNVDILAGLNGFDHRTYMPFLGIDTKREQNNPLDKTAEELKAYHDFRFQFRIADLEVAAETALLLREIIFGEMMRGTEKYSHNLLSSPDVSLIYQNGVWADPEAQAVYEEYYQKAKEADIK